MLNLDDTTVKSDDKTWPYRKLIIGSSGLGKTNYLLNSIKKDKIYLYAKDLEEPKYQFLITKTEQAGIKNLNYLSAFTECSNNMDDIYDDINDYNKNRKRKILTVFDDMISHFMSNTTSVERIAY